MATGDDPVPVYTAEDVSGGSNVLSGRLLYQLGDGLTPPTSVELDPAQDTPQQPRLQAPLTRYPEALLHGAAVFCKPRRKATTSKTLNMKSLTGLSGAELAQQEQQKRAQGEVDKHNAQIIDSFFDAVRSKNVEIVTRLVSSGVVSPDVSDDIGSTPLIVATDVGDATMVRCLLELGAEIDALAAYDNEEYPRSSTSPSMSQTHPPPCHLASNAVRRSRGRLYFRHTTDHSLPLRTALQVAAARGNLVIVKLLMTNNLGSSGPADDAIIAPDGQIALRLAAVNGHREVVDYLPSRRGGEFLRWKVAHSIALNRVRRAGKKLIDFFIIVLWRIPRFFLWTCPKQIVVKPAIEMGKYTWEHKGEFPAWCKRQVTKLPSRAERLGRVCKHIGKRVGHGVTKLPSYIGDVLDALWKLLKKLPPASRIVGVYLLNALKAAGQHAMHMLGRLVSVMHTALLVLSRFFRGVTARDVLNGLVVLLRAVFVSFPRDVLFEKCILGGARAARDVLDGMFGLLGTMAGWLGVAVLGFFAYAPRQVYKMFKALGKSGAKAMHEVLVWVDPKR